MEHLVDLVGLYILALIAVTLTMGAAIMLQAFLEVCFVPYEDRLL